MEVFWPLGTLYCLRWLQVATTLFPSLEFTPDIGVFYGKEEATHKLCPGTSRQKRYRESGTFRGPTGSQLTTFLSFEKIRGVETMPGSPNPESAHLVQKIQNGDSENRPGVNFKGFGVRTEARKVEL